MCKSAHARSLTCVPSWPSKPTCSCRTSVSVPPIDFMFINSGFSSDATICAYFSQTGTWGGVRQGMGRLGGGGEGGCWPWASVPADRTDDGNGRSTAHGRHSRCRKGPSVSPAEAAAYPLHIYSTHQTSQGAQVPAAPRPHCAACSRARGNSDQMSLMERRRASGVQRVATPAASPAQRPWRRMLLARSASVCRTQCGCLLALA